MSLRARLTLVAAAAVAFVVVVAAPATYLIVRSQLYGEVDASLEAAAAPLADGPLFIDHRGPEPHLRMPGGGFGFALSGTFVQAYDSARRQSVRPLGQTVTLPISAGVRASATGDRGSHFENGTIDGVPVRQYVLAFGNGFSVQVLRPIADTQSALRRVRNMLVVLALAGIGIAAALGLVVARTALRPVRRMTETAERVTVTRDLTERIPVEGNDELSRLARSFNQMLAALEESSHAQSQLVSDASHELRTPLTSLRTNIEVLALDRAMPDAERRRLLEDVVEQLGEMTALVAELTELARGERQPAPHEEVRLDLVTSEAIRRTRRNHPDVQIEEHLAPSTVVASPAEVERAIGNLLDNAAKWTATGTAIEIRVDGGEVTVRDHGPGIDDLDLPHVFERFYRSDAARSMPGAGLGLAIVRQVAQRNGGTISVERPADGGTLMRLRLDATTAPVDPAPVAA